MKSITDLSAWTLDKDMTLHRTVREEPGVVLEVFQDPDAAADWHWSLKVDGDYANWFGDGPASGDDEPVGVCDSKYKACRAAELYAGRWLKATASSLMATAERLLGECTEPVTP